MSARTRIALAAVMLTAVSLAAPPAEAARQINGPAWFVCDRYPATISISPPRIWASYRTEQVLWANQLQRWNGTTRQWYNYSRFTTWSSFNYYGQGVTAWAGGSLPQQHVEPSGRAPRLLPGGRRHQRQPRRRHLVRIYRPRRALLHQLSYSSRPTFRHAHMIWQGRSTHTGGVPPWGSTSPGKGGSAAYASDRGPGLLQRVSCGSLSVRRRCRRTSSALR